MEENHKNEPVHCPVCRTLWPYHMTSPSGNFTLEGAIPPAPGGEGGVAKGAKTTAGAASNLILSRDKLELLGKLKEVHKIWSHDGHMMFPFFPPAVQSILCGRAFLL